MFAWIGRDTGQPHIKNVYQLTIHKCFRILVSVSVLFVCTNLMTIWLLFDRLYLFYLYNFYSKYKNHWDDVLHLMFSST